MGGEAAAEFGAGAGFGPRHELGPGAGFERLDALRDGGLGEAEILCGRLEPAVAQDGGEGGELGGVEMH